MCLSRRGNKGLMNGKIEKKNITQIHVFPLNPFNLKKLKIEKMEGSVRNESSAK